MKHCIRLFALLTLYVLFSNDSPAQKMFNVWQFGQGAWLDFNGGAPVALSGGMLYTTEGSASVADDSTGQLLFYTDGVNVYDSTHMLMPNGTGLSGDVTTTQSALIVRQPGSDSLFFVFTVPADGGLTDLRYSIVDMSLNSGKGDVAVKNVFMAAGSGISEKATAIHHCNGSDWWVIFHARGGNHYESWLLTASGLSASPVVSATGTLLSTDLNRGVGWMTPSTDAKRIAMASYSGGTVDIVDFDNESGTMSGPLVLTGFTKAYGLAFSPNDDVLYVTDDMSLVQYDLSSGDSATIAASRTTIITEGNMMRAIRPAPDGNIYVAREWEAYLGVVNDPDVVGTGCNYSSTGISLSPGGNSLGLPNTYSFAAPQCPVGIDHELSSLRIRVFPQPASSTLFIEVMGGEWAADEMRLLDLRGKVMDVLPVRRSDGTYSLSINALPEGLYFLRVTAHGEQLCQRILKQ